MMIRPEAPLDQDDIRRITQAAFAGTEHSSGMESRIVDALRDAGMLTLSLVADEDGLIVGHVAFSPVLIDGRDHGWLGLGPISVLPDCQRRGIGSALIREGLARIRARGAKGCVVLGQPDFYRRLGFENDPNLRFDGAPPEYFLRLRLADAVPIGPVTYPRTFYE